MADITSIKNFKLKIIFIIHFTLISLGATGHWEPTAYIFYNSMLMLAIFWSIHHYESEEPVQIMIFYLHFFLVTLISLGNISLTSFILHNILFVLCIMWGIDKTDYEAPLQLAFSINAISIILDILVLALDGRSNSSFSIAMAIINLIVRPVTTFMLGRIIQQRLGTSGPISNIGDLFPGGRTSYEDIDRTAQSSQASQGGYDFSSAQQI